MLKSLDPILNADVLHALRSMGHGDDLVLCDTNFPADSVARQTVLGKLIRIDNVTSARSSRAAFRSLQSAAGTSVDSAATFHSTSCGLCPPRTTLATAG